MGRKIAIMGTAGTLACPPSPYDFEWWGVGPAVFTRADAMAIEEASVNDVDPVLPSRNLKRWYELHDKKNIIADELPYWEWMKTLNCEVYMQFKDDEIPGSVRYPVEKMVEAFGPYFGGSACWMLGHAIYEHVMGDTIDLITMPGIHLSTEGEYVKERGLMNFMMGRAAGLGIRIECYDVLLPPMLYGYIAPGENDTELPERYKEKAA